MRTSTGRKLTEIFTGNEHLMVFPQTSWQSFIEFNGPSQQKRQERLLKSLVFIRGSRWVIPARGFLKYIMQKCKKLKCF